MRKRLAVQGIVKLLSGALTMGLLLFLPAGRTKHNRKAIYDTRHGNSCLGVRLASRWAICYDKRERMRTNAYCCTGEDQLDA